MEAYGYTGLPAVAKIPVYRKFSLELCQGRHPPNLAQLHYSLMPECLNIVVTYIQKLVQSMPNPTIATIESSKLVGAYLHQSFPYFLPQSFTERHSLNSNHGDGVSFIRQSCCNLHA